MAILAIVCLLGAVAFGWVTLKSVQTGETLDFGNRFAERSKDPDWFWAWTLINGATAIGCGVTFLLLVAAMLFANP